MHNKLTESDIKEMKEELHYRVCELRGELLKEVKRTREYGDLSENAEYKCAKQEQNKNERRIRYLTKMIDTAEVIEDYTVGDGAGIFSRVTLYFEDDDEEQTVLLVSTVNIDIDNDMISVESPVGKAIMGHKEGDRVTVSDKSGRIYHARASDSVRYPSHCVTVVEVTEVSVPASQESAEGGTADQKG